MIGGLSKTVMKDGRTMWLSPAAADRWAEEVEPEPDPEPEPERRAGRDCCSRPETLQEEPNVEEPGADVPPEAQAVEPEPEGDSQLEPEPGPTPQQKQLRPARRWLCLSGCSASVSTTQLREI